MTAYLDLPSDLLLHLDHLSAEELHQVLPSQYEIERLNLKQLSQQMVHNTFELKQQQQISESLGDLLLYWMLIAEDPRLRELTHSPTTVHTLLYQYLSIVLDKNQGIKTKDIHPRRPKEFQHPYHKTIFDCLVDISQSAGTYSGYYTAFNTLIHDHKYILSHPIQVALFAVAIISPLSFKPEDSFAEYHSLMKMYEQRGLEFLATQLRFSVVSYFFSMARWETALEYYIQVEQYANSNGFSWIWRIKNNRGIVLFNTGRWDEAVELYSEMLERDPENLSIVNNLADAYSRKGEYEQAWKFGKQYLECSDSQIILNYEFLQPVIMELDLDDSEAKLMNKVHTIAAELDIPPNQIMLQLMEARHARYQLNMGLAQMKINKALEQSLSWKNLDVIFMILLEKINIHLDLVSMQPTDNNRQRLFNSVDTLIQLSDDQQVALGSIQGLRLRSQIYQSSDQLAEAREDLYNAAKLAGEFEYQGLYQELEAELAELKTLEKVPEETRQSIFSMIKERLREIVGIGAAGEFESRSYTTHGAILMSNIGLPIFTSYVTDKLKSDSSLISGLISAVSSMLNEATQTKGYLKTIQRDDFSLLFEPISEYLLVSIVSEDSFDARQRLQLFSQHTRKILEKYGLNSDAYEIPTAFEREMQVLMQEQLLV